jgi:hypothetical protein
MATRRRRIPSSSKESKRAPSTSDYDEEVDDSEAYDEPRRSRRRARDDEEEETPRRSRRRARDEEEEEEEEAPRRSRRSRDEDDDDDDDDRKSRKRSRRSRDDDDEDDERSKRPALRGGWAEAEKNKTQGDWAKEVKLQNEEQVFKFIDDEPFVSYRQHWIERPGKKSFTCLDRPTDKDKICPLCSIGDDKPRSFNAFNVLRLEGDEEPTLEVLVAGVKLTEQLKAADKGRNGPLTEHYWAISRSGKGNSTAYNLIPVKERDLEDEWDVVPLDDDEIDEWVEKAYTPKTFPDYTSKRDLNEIAAEIEDD